MRKPVKPDKSAPRSGQYEIVGPRGGGTGQERSVVRSEPLSPTPKPGTAYKLVDPTKSLNIKNPETHRLAARVAAVTGESLTEAVTIALRERLARLQQPDTLAEELMRIASDCAPRFKEPWRSVDHGDLLYDDKGMPK